jgi:hypothetical protein
MHMNISSISGQIPAVAIGKLSGNLPTNVTTAAGPLPGPGGVPSGSAVGLEESNAVQGVTFTPFKQMQVSGGPLSPQMLATFQQLFQMQVGDGSNPANGATTPTG